MNCRPASLFPGRTLLVAGVAIAISFAGRVQAGDWPAWRGNAGHTAATSDELPPVLRPQWVRQYSPRIPAWADLLNRDLMQYDRIFEPVVAGGRMFLAFNDTDKVVALDLEDGSEIWSFYTDGPVRFSPVVDNDSVFVASDDGWLYCLAARDGSLRWRFRGAPSDRQVIGNDRIISSWPARGGPVVADGRVYFAAGIWPFMGTFVYALDASTGQVCWLNDDTSATYQKQPHDAPSFAGVAPQGQLAVAGDLLLVPGGRTLPAAYDRQTGRLRFFRFGGKGEGGTFLAADQARAFVHTRIRGTMALSLPDGRNADFRINEPVLAGDVLYAAADASPAKDDRKATPPTIAAYDSKNKKLWEIAADGTGDLILAGSRLYAAGKDTIAAIDLPRSGKKAQIAWSIPSGGEVVRLLAAAERLFAVTLDGRIMAFGAKAERLPEAVQTPVSPRPAAQAMVAAERILQSTERREGYALWYGIDDPELLEAVVLQSKLHVLAIDPSESKIAQLRRRFDQAGLYGKRIALRTAGLGQFAAPPYIADLIYVGPSLAGALYAKETLRSVYQQVRPYGGKLWIHPAVETADAQRKLATEELAGAKVTSASIETMITRAGPLPGAGEWTHAYGNVANTVKSADRLVKLPLGILWFGGPSNEDALPRHGHGPSEQVVGGRLFIEGMNCLSARDVYTGRVLWKREFDDLGTFHVYFDETYEHAPYSTAYNQVHLPGANVRGTNFVATQDGVYLVTGSRCLLLDVATGETQREFVLPAGEDGKSPEWGYVGVYEDLLLAGAGFGRYSDRLGYQYEAANKRGVAWSPDRSASLGLTAFDRNTGAVRWHVDAVHSFIHNGICAGGGRVYLLDKLPKRVEEQNRRRGRQDASTYRLMAVDASTGETRWTVDKVFGTWLSYSQQHDVLLQAGASASDRGLDEVSSGMAVYRAADGNLVWEKSDFSYAGPCILHGDSIITNTTSYKQSEGALGLLDGRPVTIEDPVTGEILPWKFVRTYGCNTAVASENLLTFRSGAAGFYDLASHGGTGNFGGFKSGCTSNLIVADGVLNAPDYTRTCTCGYQNQTSLAMVSMPENEMWSYSLFAQPSRGTSEIQRIGVNFGAPGDRVAEDGTMWVNYPPDAGASPRVWIETEGEPRWYCNHASRIASGQLPWVAASGAEGLHEFTVRLARLEVCPKWVLSLEASADDAEEDGKGEVDLSSSDLELTEDETPQTVGIRFQKVPLMAGDPIERAYLQFAVDEATSAPTQLEIRGQAIDNCPAFAAKKNNLSSRETTRAVVHWRPEAWTTRGEAGPKQQTPDLTAILQEITGRPGWKEGQSLAFIIRGSGKRVAAACSGQSAGVPRLVIEMKRDDTGTSRPPRPCTVHMVFAEPDESVKAGERVFDILLQGKTVASGVDIAARAGGGMKSIVAVWKGVPVTDSLHVELRSKTGLGPILSGLKIERED